MKNGHSEDDTFHAPVKLKILKVFFIIKSVTLKLIEVKRNVSVKRVLWLFFTSFRYL